MKDLTRQVTIMPGLSGKLRPDGRLYFESWKSTLRKVQVVIPAVKYKSVTTPLRVNAGPAKVPQWIADKIAVIHPLSGNDEANANRFRCKSNPE